LERDEVDTPHPGALGRRTDDDRGVTGDAREQPARLVENLAVFDFALSAEEMAVIDGLDRHRRFNDPGEFCEKAFNTFFPIFD